MLKLNSEKTEFIIFASKKSPGCNMTPSLPWHLRDINISSYVRSLDVILTVHCRLLNILTTLLNPVTSTLEILDESDSFSLKKLVRGLLLHW